jgi:TonB-linked SusC/RagA family outer membrane protein
MYNNYTDKFDIPIRYHNKLLLIMRLITVILMATIMQVSASSFAQKITLSEKDATLTKVFKQIRNQSGYDFIFTTTTLKGALPVTIQVKNANLNDVLNEIFAGQPFEYTIDEKAVVIKPKSKPGILGEMANYFARINVKGRVVDSIGNPLQGASIKVMGADIATTSNSNGEFYLPGVDEKGMIEISFIGYQSRKIQSKPNLGDIQLVMVSGKLDEVKIINTGYQRISQERATGAYSFVNASQLENKLKPDLKSAMEGLVAGMVLTKEGNTEIRGVSTFNAEQTPLVVVDGFPISGGLETINVDNVETITVLKDAVAASIYGVKSSNGVIVITTKSGRKGAVAVEYKGSIGVELKPNLSYLNRTSSSDYIDAELQQFTQSPTTPTTNYTNYRYVSQVTYLAIAKAQGLITSASFDQQIAQLKSNDGLKQLQDYLFRNQITQQHNIFISGGGDKTQTAVSAKFISDRGNSLYTSDTRMILDWKNDWKPVKNVSVRFLSNINYSTSQAPLTSVTSLLDYSTSALLHPYDLVIDPATGQPQNIFATNPLKTARYAAIPGLKPLDYNPLTDLGLEKTNNETLLIKLGGSINVILADGLSLDAGGTWTRGSNLTRARSSANSYRMRLAYDDETSISNSSKHYIPDGDMLNESRNISEDYTLRGQLNFNKTYGKHSVMAIAGTEVSRSTLDNNAYPTRFGYNDQAGTFATFNYADYSAGLYTADMLFPAPLAAGIGSISSRDVRFASFYGNASYEFDRRFLVSGSTRLDLTNFFGTDPKYRYKPIWSVGGTYKVSNEKYFDVPWISKFYLRGSYGLNGNIDLNSGPFLIIAPGTAVSTLTGAIPYSITSPPNNSLRWEKTVTTNVGTDISFSKPRINLSVDYYLRRSELLLASDLIDPTLGYSSLTKNVGQLNNTGFELTLDGNVLKKNHFVWNVLGTASFNKTAVINYNVNYTSPLSLVTSPVDREGYPSDAIFSYRFAGINNAGSPLYWNAAGQKVTGANITVNDLVYSGTARPNFSYGLTNTFHYKDFDLAFMLIAKTGGKMRAVDFFGDNYTNKDVAKRWKVPGDETSGSIYPKLSTTGGESLYFSYADIFVENASFIKLRDVSLSYHLNKKLIRRVGFSDALVTFEGRNLFMLSANSDHQDPEAYDPSLIGSNLTDRGFSSLPPRPEFYLGLKLNF